MRRFLLLVTGFLLVSASVGLAQESLCNPCVDPPINPPGIGGEPGQFSPQRGRRVITVEEMRDLGVVSVTESMVLPDGAAPLPLSAFPQGYGTQYFDIGGDHAALGVPVAELGALFDEVYAYVSERTGVSVDGLIPVTVQPANTGRCPIRGRASSQAIWLYAGAETSREQLLGVLAHELGHVLQFREIPAIGRVGGNFMQGYASWAAGRYWTDWQSYPSFAAAVRAYLEDDSFLPLSSPPSIGFAADGEDAGSAEDCLARRDVVINEWASLIEFLVAVYGREGFYQRAEAAPEQSTGAVDYAGIFDRDLEQLEADWLEFVRARR